jgi:SpoVK/Ycf46/Vps4 family AAA+-type ATPase
MGRNDRLKPLFKAFGEGDDAAFLEVAEAIISEELAANHHAFATELQKSLQKRRVVSTNPAKSNGLVPLPRDRRDGGELIALTESSVDETNIILAKECQAKIDRFLEEHRSKAKLARHGYAPKKKLLFWGPPGCGKTLTAHFIAHELGLPIGLLRLSTVISSFLGDTASHIQRVFDYAGKTTMVLLLDEVDAVGKNRDDRNDVGELKRVVNSFLQAMDTLRSGKSVVIAASNHQYLLDPALWRRFDDVIPFPMPKAKELEQLLNRLLNGVQFKGSVATRAKAMDSLSFADAERLTIEGVKTMILDGRECLELSDVLDQVKAYRRDLAAALSNAGPDFDE